MENKKSDRLFFKKINWNDFENLKSILQNKNLMILGWGKVYFDDEVKNWIKKIQDQYNEFGFSYYFILEKNTKDIVGLIGVLPITIKNKKHIEIAYIIDEKYQGKGYALESSKMAIDFIFNDLNKDECIAQTLPENISSKKVIEKLGMKLIDEYTRIQESKNKLHHIYSIYKK